MTNTTTSDSAPNLRPLGWLMLVLVSAELLFLYSGIKIAGYLSHVLVIGMFVIAWRSLHLREAYLLSIIFILVAMAFYLQKPMLDLITEALTRSAFLASFILLMALLREGAQTSPAVLEVGKFLTEQPSKTRYAALFGGGHFFAVLINLGSMSLLAPIIQRGVRATLPDGAPMDDIARVRERRQISAILRGFAWFLVWAPTAVTQAVMPTLMSGIDAAKLMLTGFALASLMFVVGWIEDHFRWSNFRKKLRSEGRMPQATGAPFPKIAMRNLGLVCLALSGLSIAFMQLAQVPIVSGVMLTVPVVVIVWIWLQQPKHDDGARQKAVTTRLQSISFEAMPGYFREVAFVACAGFIGTMAAQLIPADKVSALLNLETIPGWLILWGLSTSIWLAGQIGLSPITMAVFLGSLVAGMPEMPVDITWVALAIAAGAAISSHGAPFAGGVLLLSRATGYSPMTLSWRWNGVYTLSVLAVIAVFYWLLLQLG